MNLEDTKSYIALFEDKVSIQGISIATGRSCADISEMYSDMLESGELRSRKINLITSVLMQPIYKINPHTFEYVMFDDVKHIGLSKSALSSIISCCRNPSSTYTGYLWRFAFTVDDSDMKNSILNQIPEMYQKIVAVHTKNSQHKLLFNDMFDAEKSKHFKKHVMESIDYDCTYHNYRWYFADEYDFKNNCKKEII